jgi:flagellar assembly protein FliH
LSNQRTSNRRVLKATDDIKIERFVLPEQHFHHESDLKDHISVKKFSANDASGFDGGNQLHPDRIVSHVTEQKSDEEIQFMQQKIIREAMQKAETYLDRARAEAEDIKRQAQEDGYNAGHQEGMQDGRKAALQQAQAEFQETLKKYQEAVAHALTEIGREREDSFHRYLDELKDVALAVAEKVIHVSLETSGEVIKRMILSEVEKMKKTEWIKIYIDKYDYEKLIAVDQDVAVELSRISDNVKFVVQDKEKMGYTVIETPNEMIDIGINTQMANIRDNLNGVQFEE